MISCGSFLEPLFRRGPMKAPGPRPVPDRQCLQGILYVLHTGIGWEDLPQELGFRSGMTCWRRIKRWINAGVFDDLHRILLAQLNAANEIDWSRAVIDGSHIDTKKGAPGLEFAPISSPHVSGVEDHARVVDEAGVIESVQHRLVRPAPRPGPRPDQEPAARGRLRYPETRRQKTPPGTTADQHVDDRREQRLIRRVLRSAAL